MKFLKNSCFNKMNKVFFLQNFALKKKAPLFVQNFWIFHFSPYFVLNFQKFPSFFCSPLIFLKSWHTTRINIFLPKSRPHFSMKFKATRKSWWFLMILIIFYSSHPSSPCSSSSHSHHILLSRQLLGHFIPPSLHAYTLHSGRGRV